MTGYETSKECLASLNFSFMKQAHKKEGKGSCVNVPLIWLNPNPNLTP